MPGEPPRKPPVPEVFSFEDLRFKMIEVRADGVLYRGELIGADDQNIYIKGRLRWLILPLDRITSLNLEGDKESFDPQKSVSADFYGSEEED